MYPVRCCWPLKGSRKRMFEHIPGGVFCNEGKTGEAVGWRWRNQCFQGWPWSRKLTRTRDHSSRSFPQLYYSHSVLWSHHISYKEKDYIYWKQLYRISMLPCFWFYAIANFLIIPICHKKRLKIAESYSEKKTRCFDLPFPVVLYFVMVPIGKVIHLVIEPAMIREQCRARWTPKCPIRLRRRFRGNQTLGERSVQFRASWRW